MANAKAAGLPGWVKASLGVVGVLVIVAVVMIAMGHNPLMHIMNHTGMGG